MGDLDKIRQNLDRLDEQIISLLAERKELIEQVINFKKTNDIPSLQPKRRDQVTANWRKFAKKKGLDPDIAERLWTLLHEYFLRLEEKALKKK